MDYNTFVEISVSKTKYKIDELFDFIIKNKKSKGVVFFRDSESASIIAEKANKENIIVSYNNFESEVIFCGLEKNVNDKKFDFVVDYNIPENMEILIEHIDIVKPNGKYFILYSNRDVVKIHHYNYENFEFKDCRDRMEKLGEVMWLLYNKECLLMQLKRYLEFETSEKCGICTVCREQF